MTPVWQELLELLDDYMFDFNNKILEKDKFGTIDSPVEIHFGEGYITLKATDKFRVSNDSPGSKRLIGINVEVLKSKKSTEIIWQGVCNFVFNKQIATTDEGNTTVRGVDDFWVLNDWGL